MSVNFNSSKKEVQATHSGPGWNTQLVRYCVTEAISTHWDHSLPDATFSGGMVKRVNRLTTEVSKHELERQ